MSDKILVRSFVSILGGILLSACGTGSSALQPPNGQIGAPAGTVAPSRALLVLTPTNGLQFGTVTMGEPAGLPVHVVNAGTVPATIISDASRDLGAFGYSGGSYPGTGGTCADTLPVAGGCTLAVTFSPTQVGSVSADMTLSYFDGGAMQLVAMAASGSGAASATSSSSSSSGGLGGSSSGSAWPTGVAGTVSGLLSTNAAVNKSVEYLGVATVTSGVSQTFHTTKGEGDAALTVLAVANDPTLNLAIDLITNPQGTVITSQNFVDGNGDFTPQELNRVFADTGAAAAAIPQTPDISSQTPAGSYSFDIASDAGASGEADVFVVHTSNGELRHVSVNFFFGSPAGLNAVAAAQNQAFQGVVKNFIALWGEGPGACSSSPPPGTLGLCIDSINYYDLPQGYSDITGDNQQLTADESDLVELFTQSSGAPSGVNFFFVNNVTLQGEPSGYQLLGVDGSIPSPGGFSGTYRSGAVVIMDQLPETASDQALVGSTVAHEGGHYLGLFHTQESDCSPDNLSDTPCDPNCTCAQALGLGYCYDAAPVCTGTTAEADATVMFWLSTGGVQNLFSPEQGQVARLHPLVH